jgi:hypothetical protein
MLRAGHGYYNALLEIEKRKQTALTAYYAEQGGYTAELETVRQKEEEARKMRRDTPGREEFFKELSKLRKELFAKEKVSKQALLSPEDRLRAQKSAELKASAKAQGFELSAEDLTLALDAIPGCVSPRRAARLAFERDAAARGVKVSGKAFNAQLRAKGLMADAQVFEDAAHAEVLKAREFFGIHFGTYRLVNDAVEQALATAEIYPRFKRYDGTGRVGIPIDTNKKLPVSRLHACSRDAEGKWSGDTNILRILPVDSGVYSLPRGEQRKACRTRALVCVGTKNKLPQWVEFEMMLHRPLPEDGKVVGAWIKVSPHGTGVRYDLQLQVQSVTFDVPDRSHGDITVAVNFGHRASGRVCYALDNQGRGKELLLPAELVTLRKKADEIQAARSAANNLIRESLLTWVREVAPPEAFLEKKEEIATDFRGVERAVKYRSMVERIHALVHAEESLGKRLMGIYHAWRSLREKGIVSGHAVIFGHLQEWAIEEKRNTWAENGTRKNIRARRKEMSIKWAHELCDHAKTILVENTNYAVIKRRENGSDQLPVEVNEYIRYIRDICAPGEQRLVLETIAKKRGVLVRRVDAKNLTVLHHACGHKRERAVSDKIKVECPGCGVVHDQDRNFCEGLFARAGEQLGGAENTGGARKGASPEKDEGISP